MSTYQSIHPPLMFIYLHSGLILLYYILRIHKEITNLGTSSVITVSPLGISQTGTMIAQFTISTEPGRFHEGKNNTICIYELVLLAQMRVD